MVGHLGDQRPNGFAEACILESSTTQLGRGFSIAFKHPGDELAMQLGYLDHVSQIILVGSVSVFHRGTVPTRPIPGWTCGQHRE